MKLVISLGVYAWDQYYAWVQRCLGREPRPQGVVLYYHSVKLSQRWRFEGQLDRLLKVAHPFRTDCPEQMKRGWHAAVTFDDGFVSVIEHALPELKKRNIPSTIFVPTGCLGERPSWVRDPQHPSWGERVVSAEELRILSADPLVTIGAHSVSHPNLLDIDPVRAEQELACSKADLQCVLGRGIASFSFPHGAHNDRLVEVARQLGYRQVFTTQPRVINPNKQNFALGRVPVDPDDWQVEFRLKLAGAYRWQCFLGKLRRRRKNGKRS